MRETELALNFAFRIRSLSLNSITIGGMKIIVGITGATGTIFGVRLLEFLKNSAVESHLVISKWGARTLVHETAAYESG